MSRYGRISRASGPSLMPGKPFLWPPGRQQIPAPWSPNWPETLAWSCSSTLAQLVCEHGGNPAGSPLRRTPPAHTEALETQLMVQVGSSRTAADTHACHTLTILSAGSQQVDDVLMLANHLHHFHFGDEVSPVFLCGVRCTRSHDFSFTRMFIMLNSRKAKEDDPFHFIYYQIRNYSSFLDFFWTFFLTFKHFYSNFCEPRRFVFVKPDSLGQNHLTETPFPERFSQRQSEGGSNSRHSRLLSVLHSLSCTVSDRVLFQRGYLLRGNSQTAS